MTIDVLAGCPVDCPGGRTFSLPGVVFIEDASGVRGRLGAPRHAQLDEQRGGHGSRQGSRPDLADGSPMFDGHARLRAVERDLVCACPLGERPSTCSRARTPFTWGKHPYTRHRSRAVAARRRPTRSRSRDRRRPAPSRPQLGKLSSAWPALLPGRSGLRNVQLHGEPGQDARPSPVEAVQEALRYSNGLRAWPPRARPLPRHLPHRRTPP